MHSTLFPVNAVQKLLTYLPVYLGGLVT